MKRSQRTHPRESQHPLNPPDNLADRIGHVDVLTEAPSPGYPRIDDCLQRILVDPAKTQPDIELELEICFAVEYSMKQLKNLAQSLVTPLLKRGDG